MIARQSSALARRGAFTLVEVALAAFMLTIAMTLTVQMLGWVAAERRAAERRQRAVEEVANVMEHLAARPWDRLTPEAVGDVRPSEETRARLPGAELSVGVDAKGAGGLRRLTVRLRWRGRSGTSEAPVRLTAWIARRDAQ